MAQQPGYSPNVVNQTVQTSDGSTWRGQPGGGWTQIGGPGMSGQSGSGNSLQDAKDYAQWAQAQQVAANQPAIQTMQETGKTLAEQYKTLLDSVISSGSATYNTAVSGENAYLGARGLLSQSGRGNNELSQAENIVNTTNAQNQQQVQTGAAQTQAGIAQQIASLQAGNVPNALNFGANIGQTEAGITNTNTKTQEELMAAQLQAGKPFGVGNLVFAPASNTFKVPGQGGGSPAAMARTIAVNRRQRPQMANIQQFVQ